MVNVLLIKRCLDIQLAVRAYIATCFDMLFLNFFIVTRTITFFEIFY